MQKIELITMGSDPELFLEDHSGKVISAIGKIGGNKDKPRPLKELGKGFAVQEDNVLLEYNTPPARGLANWCLTHKTIRGYLEGMVGKLKLRLSEKASHSMDDDQLDHPKAFVFGCDPDYNVWAMKWNTRPTCHDPKLRSAGGHIHVCYSNPNQADSIRLGRMLDYWVGAPLAVLDPDKRRRLLYGKPGAIRFKPYGLEYRTPSNFWTLDPHRVEAVYCNVQEAIQFVRSIDDWKKSLESARRYLAGEESGWDNEFFLQRAMPYDSGEKPKGLRFRNLPTDVELALKAIKNPEDDWGLGEIPPVVMDDEEEDDHQ